MPSDKRDLNYPEASRDLERMVFMASLANRLYAASVGIWAGSLYTVIFFVGMSLASTWAVDAPARSGRKLPPACSVMWNNTSSPACFCWAQYSF